MCVSIVIPVYNVAPYLRECVESVEMQTLKDREVILVDDGSTDGSGELCDELSREFDDIVVIHKTNGGLPSARNTGIDHAKGEYIIFLDSDDYWIGENSLESLVSSAKAFDADIVRGRYIRIDENGVEQDEFQKTISPNLSNRLLSSKELFTSVLCGAYYSWSFLFKAQVFSSLRFDEEQLFLEDVELAIRLFCNQFRCVFNPIPFYFYRTRSGSLISSYNREKLKYAFSLSDSFDEYSAQARNAGLEKEYRHSSILMYYKALLELASVQFDGQRREIIRELNLKELQRRIRRGIIAVKPYHPFTVDCLVGPDLGVRIIQFHRIIGKIS